MKFSLAKIKYQIQYINMKIMDFIKLAIEMKYDEMEKVLPLTKKLLNEAVEEYLKKSCWGKESYRVNEIKEAVWENSYYYERFEELGDYDIEYEESDFNSIKEMVIWWLFGVIDKEIDQVNNRLSDRSKEEIKDMLVNDEIEILKKNRVIADFL